MLTPVQIIERLEQIEADLAERQPRLERAAEAWTRQKREKELAWARAYMSSTGSQVTDRKAAAVLESESIGIEDEAQYVALSKSCGILETRATIGQSLLKAHGRLEGPTPSGPVFGARRAA